MPKNYFKTLLGWLTWIKTVHIRVRFKANVKIQPLCSSSKLEMKAQKIDDWREMIPTAVYTNFILLHSFNSDSSIGNKIEVKGGQSTLAITGGDHTYYMINTEKQPKTWPNQSVTYLLQVSKVALTCNQHTVTELSNQINSNITNSGNIGLSIVWSVTMPFHYYYKTKLASCSTLIGSIASNPPEKNEFAMSTFVFSVGWNGSQKR